MPFPNLDVLDLMPSGTSVDSEHLVAKIANVADGHAEAIAVGPLRAQQNRLLRPAARPTDASELQNVDDLRHGPVMSEADVSDDAGFERREPERGQTRRRLPRRTPGTGPAD